MQKRSCAVFGILLLTALAPAAEAGLVNQIPSCYAASHYSFASAPPRAASRTSCQTHAEITDKIPT